MDAMGVAFAVLVKNLSSFASASGKTKICGRLSCSSKHLSLLLIENGASFRSAEGGC